MASNPFFDFRVSPYRFAPLTLARASSINARLDEVTDGFDTVKAAVDLKAPSASPTFTGTVTFNTTAVNITAGTVTVPSPGAITDDSTKVPTTAWVHDLLGSLSVGLPSQAGQVDPSGLFTNGTTASWQESVPLKRRQILQANPGLVAASAGEPIDCVVSSPGIGTLSGYFAYGSGLYVIGPGVASVNAVSSPDALTWTGRTMPASKVWVFGSDGTNFLAVVAADTAVAKSADGVTWSSATALPAGVTGVQQPIKVAGLWLVIGQQTTYYTSPDGTTWTTRTLPAACQANGLRLVGSTAWVRTGATTAYTSTDGINWTIRTISNFNVTGVAEDGSLEGQVDVYSPIMSTTDGVTWTSTGVSLPGGVVGLLPATINGVRLAGTSSFLPGLGFSYAEGAWTLRTIGEGVTPVISSQTSPYAAVNRGVLGGRWVASDVASSTRIAVIAPSASVTALYR